MEAKEMRRSWSRSRNLGSLTWALKAARAAAAVIIAPLTQFLADLREPRHQESFIWNKRRHR